jgi:plastocyanin domain-containing protein
MIRLHRLVVLPLLGLLGSGVLGCTKSDPTIASATVSAAASPQADGKSNVVNVIANDKGFTPSAIDVKKGAATTLVFTRTTDDTCARQVVFPELKVTKDLPLNEKVSFDVPANDARTLTFQCGMGMFKGKIVIQ